MMYEENKRACGEAEGGGGEYGSFNSLCGLLVFLNTMYVADNWFLFLIIFDQTS